MNEISKEELEAALKELDDIGDKATHKFEEGKLKGYKIRIRTDGEHFHDGQMVEYEITFTAPKTRKQTTITTLMCLSVGWNFTKDNFIIK